MSLDQGKFFRVQPTGSTEDRRRDGHFADIVNQTRHTDPLDLVRGKAHLPGNGLPKLGNPALVTRRIGIPSLDNQGHGLDRPVQGITQLLEAAAKAFFCFFPFLDLLMGILIQPRIFNGNGRSCR